MCVGRICLAVLAAAQLAANPVAATSQRPLSADPTPLTVPAPLTAHVLVFTAIDCPIANRYAPEVRRLAQHFAGHGIRFWMIYPDARSDDEARQHASRFTGDLAVLRDPRGTLVRQTRVRVTPEVVVIAADGQQVYRGRIDDRYVAFGRDRIVPTTHDLEDVLSSLARGAPVAARVTEAVGCYIP
jgi:hypothetical protein